MEINFNVKVNAGKRTPASVNVILTSVNPKTLTLINGKTISDQSIADWIETELLKTIRNIELKAVQRRTETK
jgi:hypothetical protein